MIIDCDSCAVRGPACGDCVVPVMLGMPTTAASRPAPAGAGPAGQPIDLDGHEQAALAVLAGSGLVPPLRLVPSDAEQDGKQNGEQNGERDGERSRRAG